MSSVFIIGQHSQNACPIPNTDIESELLAGDMSNDKISNITVFTKVLQTLQDIRSGKVTFFTRPGTSLPDQKKS